MKHSVALSRVCHIYAYAVALSYKKIFENNPCK